MFSLKKYLKDNKELDIASCRNLKPYSFFEYFKRIMWSIAKPAFYLSPRNMFRWRSFLLRLFGAKVGKNVNIYPSAIIYMPWNLKIGDFSSIGEWALIYSIGKIDIGKAVTISHKAQLCSATHDYEDPKLPLIKKKIIINDFAWICTDAFIGPGCNIGEGSIIGAKSVVLKNIDKWGVFVGNPVKFLKNRQIKK